MNAKTTYTVPEIAEALSMDTKTIDIAVERRLLDVIRPNRRGNRRVTRAAIDRWLGEKQAAEVFGPAPV